MSDSNDKPDKKVHLPVVQPAVDGPIRDDLDDGLRFLHVMGMQVKHDLYEASTQLQAVVEEMMAKGQIDPAAFEARRQRIKQRELARHQRQAQIQVAEPVDKYTVKNAEIDCASLIPICKARCCKLYFCLSFQDLNEGGIEWDYSMPYVIRRRTSDGYCAHNVAGTGMCGVYEKRPAACRTYDCRKDPRVWVDFEKRIPADESLT
jgi:hypothetical protein